MYLSEHLKLPVFGIVRDVSRQLGLRCYVIGGWVRDLLLQRPCKDIDIVVEGSGIALAEAVAQKMGVQAHVYANFGTAMAHFEDYLVEFVGARKESYRQDSRKPIVEDGALYDDQLRRDFTVNALSISLNDEDWGMLYDPFGGVADLDKGLLRTPANPDITFSDDPLRMMRGIRFSAQLGFNFDPAAYEAIRRNAERISIVSAERIIDELNKIVMAPVPSRGFLQLWETGLLALIFPELAAMHGVEYQNGQGHKDNLFHTLKVLDNVAERSDNLWLRWVALLHDIGKPRTKRFDAVQGWTFHGHEDLGARMTPGIFKRLRLPTDHRMKYVQKLVGLHQRPISLVNEPVTDSAIRRIVVDAGEDLEDLLLFCQCDITSASEAKVRRYLENYELLKTRIHEVEARDQLRNWQPPISGEMIMEVFGLRPGPQVGLIKMAIREAILDGIIPNDKAEAIAYMQRVGPAIIAGREI